MQVDDVAHDRQAEPEPAAGALQRLVALDEALEDVLEQLARNAVAVVGDREQRLAAILAQVDADVPRRRRELGGIGEQVADHLGQPHRIAVDPHRLVRKRDHGRNEPARERRPGLLERAADDLAQVGRLLVQLDLAGGDARDVEQVVDQAREVPHLALDDVPLGRAGGAFAPRHQLERGDDRRQRVAQLVAEHGEELVLDPAGRLRLRQCRARLGEQAHVVERERGAARDLADQGDVVGLEAAPRFGLDHGHRADGATARDQRHDAGGAQADDANELGHARIRYRGDLSVVEVADEGLAGRDRPRKGARRLGRRDAARDPAR